MVLALHFELTGLGLIFGAVLGVFLVMGIPAVNSISQDVVTPGLKGISWGVGGFIAMVAGAAWAPSAVGAISDSLGGGTEGLKTAMMVMPICGIVSGFLFWMASKPYPADRDKVSGAELESE